MIKELSAPNFITVIMASADPAVIVKVITPEKPNEIRTCFVQLCI